MSSHVPMRALGSPAEVAQVMRTYAAVYPDVRFSLMFDAAMARKIAHAIDQGGYRLADTEEEAELALALRERWVKDCQSKLSRALRVYRWSAAYLVMGLLLFLVSAWLNA